MSWEAYLDELHRAALRPKTLEDVIKKQQEKNEQLRKVPKT